jgi:hypothetical protein
MTDFDEGIMVAHREDCDILLEIDGECEALRAAYRRQSRRLVAWAVLCFWIGVLMGFALAYFLRVGAKTGPKPGEARPQVSEVKTWGAGVSMPPPDFSEASRA